MKTKKTTLNFIILTFCFLFCGSFCFASETRGDFHSETTKNPYPAPETKEDLDGMDIGEVIDVLRKTDMEEIKLSINNLGGITFPTETVKKDQASFAERFKEMMQNSAAWIGLQLWENMLHLAALAVLFGILKYMQTKKEGRCEENGKNPESQETK